jgi:acyl-homoserine lactone acylase PvdQ
VLHPARGWVATANNRQWPGDSRHHGGRVHDSGFRAFRIEELLGKSAEHSVSSFARIQCDVQAVDARFLLPELLGVLAQLETAAVPKPREWRAIKLLREWDYQATLSCQACPIFRRWLQRIEEDLGLNAPALHRTIALGTAVGQGPETRMKIVEAFQAALDDLKITPSEKELERFPTWEKLHYIRFRHLSSRVELGPRGQISTSGDAESVNPGSMDWTEDRRFEQTAGASQRVIVEMSQPPQIYAVLSGPNSGRASSLEKALEDKDSPWQPWRDCKIEKRLFPIDWSSVEAQEVSF